MKMKKSFNEINRVYGKGGIFHYLINGDNEIVMRKMIDKYENKIQFIYIDPPYNTKNNDIKYDEKMTHSKWLSMMKSRLELAWKLLSKDGVIFISIDDNELYGLKILMDEIFGEENFIGNIIRKSHHGVNAMNSSNKLFIMHDYILVYCKNKNHFKINKDKLNVNDGSYKYEDEYVNKRGKYKLNVIDTQSNGYSKSLAYPIEAPDGSIIWPGGMEKGGGKWRWIWGRKKFEWGLKNGYIIFKKNKDGKWRVYYKRYQYVDNEGNKIIKEKLYDTLLLDSKYYNIQGTRELKKIFNDRVFNYPKPVNLIMKLLEIGSKKDSIILDFFGGSGTTGHAVMKLNERDGGKRKFIIIEKDENIFYNICVKRLNGV